MTLIFKLMDERIQFMCWDLAKKWYSVLINLSAFSLGGEFCAMTSAVHGQGDDSGNVFILLLIPPVVHLFQCHSAMQFVLSHLMHQR